MKIENLQIDEVNCFNHEHGKGLVISWSANIGFGELTLYQRKGEDKWEADTECMGIVVTFVRDVEHKRVRLKKFALTVWQI